MGSSTLLGDFFPACFLPCASRSRGRHSRRLACLRLHVLRAYCNFESKQAISITLFGRRPNNNNIIKIINKGGPNVFISVLVPYWNLRFSAGKI